MSANSEDELNQAIIQIIRENKPQNTRQLVNLVKEKHFIPEEKILDAILKLQSQGQITLESQPTQPTPKLTTYLKNGQALWYWATVATATITTITTFLIPEDFYPWAYVRQALGIIFVLWLPGYAFIKALFPKQPPIKTSAEHLETIERIALSLGMSLALVPIIGLLLNYTPWGIRLTPIVLSLLALTLIFATAAAIREQKNK